jgi:Fic family protein
MFAPVFRITPAVTRSLMEIEACRQAVLALPIDVAMLQSLRETARITSTHYSTMIEGNRLTEPQVRQVLAGVRFPGRERDEVEVRNYYRALEWLETRVMQAAAISEADIKRLHGLAFHGRNRATPYRDGQNVIRDAGSGRIVYLPPEAADVPGLMAALVAWVCAELASAELPVPIVAALAHYQVATIHPWFDGNGRTARLWTTLLLHRAGFGLKGIYSLDEHYGRNLSAYYQALTVGPSHNYYEGRAEADLTAFIEYFCGGMAGAFAKVRAAASAAGVRQAPDQTALLRALDPRRRRLLELFRRQDTATAVEIARHLGLSHRTIVDLCRTWLADGFLEFADASRKNRAYRLAGAYEPLVASIAPATTER